VVLATGDLAPDRDEVASCFVATAATLRDAELTFGQLETSFAVTGTRLPQARHAVLAAPAGAIVLDAMDPRFEEVHRYLMEVTREAGLNGRLRRAGNRLILDAPVERTP